MIANKFTLLLQELSKELSMDLKPDENNSCLIVIQDKLKIQLELDPEEKNLIIGSILTELPPGKFREDILLSSLTANAKRYPRLGTFAYSKKLNSLVLFEMIELEFFNVENILSMLTPFIKKALLWKEALEQGHHAPSEDNFHSHNDNTHFFGG